ncbi:stress response protein YsnF [Frigoribacterium sp. PvP054]|uniref:DUF2382 domain-containing protein n=1 Tax=Frigoribacterium sp. PvP054 TaxID=3156438 RepID=UPI00339B8751
MTTGTVGPVDPPSATGRSARVDGSAVPADASVLLSAERARLATVAVPVGRVRLRKVVVSHEETITVTVRREELQVVHEDLPPGGATPTRATATPLDLVLHEERPVVSLVVVPVERVRVTVDRIVEDVDVTTTLRHERVDVSREPATRPPV